MTGASGGALDLRVGPATQRFAVLGESLGHTWSPAIHNSLFLAAGRDAIYLPVTVPPDRLSSAADVLRSCFGGFNVTIPYKERILPLLDEVSDAARVCGAVNTVTCRDGRLLGDITDGAGMLAALTEGGVHTENADALIVGGGGAARAAAVAFIEKGGRVTFAVRDVEKGKRLARELSASLGCDGARLSALSLGGPLGTHDVLIQCTPVGMLPHADACPVTEADISRCGAVFDAVYNPRETLLLRTAKRLGVPCVEGLGMLYYQAVEAEKRWFGDVGVAPGVQRDIYRQLLARF